MKFAAIDIGSNAIRLLLKRVMDDGQKTIFQKESLIRMPLRLGDDVFSKKRVSQDKIRKLIDIMRGFKNLLDAYQPIRYDAFATSAMREALNGDEIADKIKDETGIALKIIDGREEAQIIFSTHSEKAIFHQGEFLHIDVGGGSTELMMFAKGNTMDSNSFRIGTVRILQGMDNKNEWTEMKTWLRKVTRPYKKLLAVGSGGNINKLFQLAGKKEGQAVSFEKIKSIKANIEQYELVDRINILGLRPDRADVIIPASDIYLSVMQWANIKKVYVPQIGLADGMIHLMYERFRKEHPIQFVS
ncbi:MAG: exopolyphosphatase [Deltaproteobacteria bacterium]|nr:exopolyphosphatase [Deltaproteobacteria bacterium]